MQKNLKLSHERIVRRERIAETASKHPVQEAETKRDKLRTTEKKGIREVSQTVSSSQSVSKQESVAVDKIDTLYDSNHSGVNRQSIILPPWSAS